MELDVRHFRLIVAVADNRSVSGAARALGMAQPTASVQLQRIERTVGSRMFERGPDGVVVTEAGRALLWHARHVLEGVEGLLDDVSHVDAAADATIRVASVNAGVERALGHLVRSRPDARWAVTSRSRTAGVAALLAGELDLLVVARHASAPVAELPDGIDSRFVLSTRLRATLPAAHPAAAELLVDLRDLADDVWITGVDPDAHDAVVRECRSAGLEPEVSHRVDDAGSMELLVETTGAVTVAPVWHDVRPGVVQRPYRDAGALVWHVLSHRAGADTDLADDVAAALQDAYGVPAAERDSSGKGGIGSARRPLRVGTEQSPLVGATAGALRERHGLVTTMTVGGLGRLVGQVEDGRLDLLLVHEYPAAPGDPIPAGWSELTAVDVEPLRLAVHPAHPLAGRAVVELAELHDQPWVLPGVQSERDRSSQLAILRSAGLTPWVVASWTHGRFLPGLLYTLRAVALVGSVPPDEQLVLVRVVDGAARRRVAVAWRGGAGLDEPAAHLARVHHDLVCGRARGGVDGG